MLDIDMYTKVKNIVKVLEIFLKCQDITFTSCYLEKNEFRKTTKPKLSYITDCKGIK